MNVSYKPYRYDKYDNARVYTGLTWHNLSPYKVCAIGFVIIGIGILTYAYSPIVFWQFVTKKTSELAMPVIGGDGKFPNEAPAVLGTDNTDVEIHQLEDGFSYFSPKKRAREAAYKQFSLSIPEVNITNAVVMTNSSQFEQNLGHFPGSALPGEVGNVFITGHSALPQFFSTKNYKTIFSVLPKLDILDEVTVKVGDKSYTYVVEKTSVVDPSDISVIEPPDAEGKYLTLMTCVPPGLLTKRLVVLARLAE